MRHLAILVLLSASLASAQTAIWPGSVVTDSQLLVAANLCTARLTTAVPDTTSTTFNITNTSVSGTCFVPNMELQIDNEFVFVVAVPSAGRLTVTRGFDHSTASPHLINTPINNVPAAWYHNAMRVEIEAVEAWMGSLINQPPTNDVSSQVSPRMNVGVGGVTQYMIIKLDSAGSAIMGTGGYSGISQATAPAGSTARVAMAGISPCVFDGAAVIGNQVVASQTVLGDCHDSGLTSQQLVPATTPSIGIVMAAAASAGQLGTVKLHGMGVHGGGYSPGLPNTGNISMTAKASQTFALDDFNDGSYLPGHNCSPSSTTAVNNIACANAIKWASQYGVKLTCQSLGTAYQISQALPLVTNMIITGNGGIASRAQLASGCTIQQTDPTQDIFATDPMNSRSLLDVHVSYLALTGGRNAFNISGVPTAQDPTHQHFATMSDMEVDHVQFGQQSKADIYHNDNSAIQRLHTSWNVFNTQLIPGAAAVWEDFTPGYNLTFIAGWFSYEDKFNPAYQGMHLTCGGGGSCGGHYFARPRFQGGTLPIIEMDGAIYDVVMDNPSFENVGYAPFGIHPVGGPIKVKYTTCTATAGSTTLPCADTTDIQIGDTVNIGGAANTATAANMGYGPVAYGIDFNTVVTGGGNGAATLTLQDAPQLSVTNAPVTNATQDLIHMDYAAGSAGSPTNIRITGTQWFGYGQRYSMSVPYNSYGIELQFPFFGSNMWQQPIYDPGGHVHVIDLNQTGAPTVAPSVRTPHAAIGTAGSIYQLGFIQSAPNSYTLSPWFPTLAYTNPSAMGGALSLGCADNGGNIFGSCGSQGVFGPWLWWLNATANNKPMRLDPNGSLWIGQSASAPNVFIGPVTQTNGTPDARGALSSLIMKNGTAPTTCIAGQAGLTVLAGLPWWYDSSCNAYSLTSPSAVPTNQLAPVAGPPTTASEGALAQNTVKKAPQVTRYAATNTFVTAPQTNVYAGDLLCASGGDWTIFPSAVSAVTNVAQAVLTIAGAYNGFTYPVGDPIQLSGFGDTGFNGVYTVIDQLSPSALVISLNSTALTFTGAGTPRVSLACSNATDIAGTLTSFVNGMTLPANSFQAGTGWQVDSQFVHGSIQAGTVQMAFRNVNNTFYLTPVMTTVGSYRGFFPAQMTLTGINTTSFPNIRNGGSIFFPAVTNSSNSGGANGTAIVRPNAAAPLALNYAVNFGKTGIGGSVTYVSGGTFTSGVAGQMCLLTAASGGAVWYATLTGPAALSGTITYAQLPGSATGSGYATAPTSWTVSTPTANAVSGIVPSPTCSGTVVTSGAGTLVGPTGLFIGHLQDRQSWWN